MKSKPLKSLKDHNKERLESYWRDMGDDSPVPNGISCPECEKELMDTNPLTVLLTYPPKKSIHCESCGYKGYRVS
jgi:hypothetical protein